MIDDRNHYTDLILASLKEIKTDIELIKRGVIRSEIREEQYDKDIARLQVDMKIMSEKTLPQIHQDIATLRTKASIWGGIAAAIVSTLIAIGVKLSEIFLRG